MNVQELMQKTVDCPRPSLGVYYMVEEWDGTHDRVKVVAIRGDTVIMQYDDGVQHRVSALYFFEGVKAALLQ